MVQSDERNYKGKTTNSEGTVKRNERQTAT